MWPRRIKLELFQVRFHPFFGQIWPECNQINYNGTDYEHTIIAGAFRGQFRTKKRGEIRPETRPGIDKVKPKGWFKYSLQID